MSGRLLLCLLLLSSAARAEGNFALIEQIGDDNRATLRQSGGDAEATIRQRGSGHEASLTQSGGDQVARVAQSGRRNEAQQGVYFYRFDGGEFRAWNHRDNRSK